MTKTQLLETAVGTAPIAHLENGRSMADFKRYTPEQIGRLRLEDLVEISKVAPIVVMSWFPNLANNRSVMELYENIALSQQDMAIEALEHIVPNLANDLHAIPLCEKIVNKFPFLKSRFDFLMDGELLKLGQLNLPNAVVEIPAAAPMEPAVAAPVVLNPSAAAEPVATPLAVGEVLPGAQPANVPAPSAAVELAATPPAVGKVLPEAQPVNVPLSTEAGEPVAEVRRRLNVHDPVDAKVLLPMFTKLMQLAPHDDNGQLNEEGKQHFQRGEKGLVQIVSLHPDMAEDISQALEQLGLTSAKVARALLPRTELRTPKGCAPLSSSIHGQNNFYAPWLESMRAEIDLGAANIPDTRQLPEVKLSGVRHEGQIEEPAHKIHK